MMIGPEKPAAPCGSPNYPKRFEYPTLTRIPIPVNSNVSATIYNILSFT
jgi:hypothetical protein